MTKYVLGFAFTEDGNRVAMIKKNKPEWQAGLFNGLGGKIEDFDSSPLAAMIREFSEETGVDINTGWHQFASIEGDGYELYCFRVFDDRVFNIKTIESEQVSLFSVDGLLITFFKLVPSCRTLIPMALDRNFEFNKIKVRM